MYLLDYALIEVLTYVTHKFLGTVNAQIKPSHENNLFNEFIEQKILS